MHRSCSLAEHRSQCTFRFLLPLFVQLQMHLSYRTSKDVKVDICKTAPPPFLFGFFGSSKCNEDLFLAFCFFACSCLSSRRGVLWICVEFAAATLCCTVRCDSSVSCLPACLTCGGVLIVYNGRPTQPSSTPLHSL